MSSVVFLAVIGAAILHAAWNALVKGGQDKTVAMGAVILGHLPLAIVIIPFVPLPASESLGYLAAGTALHFGYQLFLLNSYRLGDLTQVYPIARGVAPLIVALVSVAVLGVALSGVEKLAVGIIAIGIISLGLVRRHDGQRNPAAVLLALGTGGFIASYSLVDGLGARIAGTSLGYYAWLSVFNCAAMAIYLAWRAPGALREIPRSGRLSLTLGGGASFLAYSLVIWAFTQAPIALVTALRETSIIFALLIGAVFLRERIDLVKVFSTAATLTGAVLLRFAR
ncbi:MAG: DMT family transporter [Pseudomonadota bacterium]